MSGEIEKHDVVDFYKYSLMLKRDYVSGFSWHIFKFGMGNKTVFKELDEKDRKRIDAVLERIYKSKKGNKWENY